MPVLFVEAPPGIRPEAKRKLVQKLTEAIDEAYHIGRHPGATWLCCAVAAAGTLPGSGPLIA
jgi:hypothetical protein